jgi:hypothetical protein
MGAENRGHDDLTKISDSDGLFDFPTRVSPPDKIGAISEAELARKRDEAAASGRAIGERLAALDGDGPPRGVYSNRDLSEARQDHTSHFLRDSATDDELERLHEEAEHNAHTARMEIAFQDQAGKAER